MPFVYFIHEDGNQNCFKVGKTENHPADRMEQLQTGNPRKLRIYRWIKIGDHSTAEEYLHTVFNEFRIRSEWFRINTDVIDEQCAIIASNDDAAVVSGQWEPYTDEDRVAVKRERKNEGKYRGKTDPTIANDRKNMFLERRNLNILTNKYGFIDE